jgi:hypothetical protein
MQRHEEEPPALLPKNLAQPGASSASDAASDAASDLAPDVTPLPPEARLSVEDPARFHIGTTIAGRFRIERLLGEGAMGAVVAACHISLDETVAIKFPRPEFRRDPMAVAHFAREAKALARIKSNHVARVLDVGVSMAVGPYMVMEYLDGTDLGSVLATSGPLRAARAVEYVLQVCEALVTAHAEGIIHRDIKPENLFLAREGQFETLKLLDFGISQDAFQGRATGGAASGAQDGPLMGTPAYMAPERIRNSPRADHRSDIWSLGIVLHELVTGRAPFETESVTAQGVIGDSVAEICARVLEDAPLPLETNEAVLPPVLRVIIERCLERDPARRYQSVQELVAALMPLESMGERLRGRLTGSFRLPKSTAVVPSASAPARRAPLRAEHAGVGGRFLAALARARTQLLPRHVVLALLGLAATALGAAYLGSLSLMQPPPRTRAAAAQTANEVLMPARAPASRRPPAPLVAGLGAPADTAPAPLNAAPAIAAPAGELPGTPPQPPSSFSAASKTARLLDKPRRAPPRSSAKSSSRRTQDNEFARAMLLAAPGTAAPPSLRQVEQVPRTPAATKQPALPGLPAPVPLPARPQ